MHDRGFTTALLVGLVALTMLGGVYGIGKTAEEKSLGDFLRISQPFSGGTGTSTVPTVDDVLIGGDNSRYDVKKLTAGTNITISTSSSAITINSSSGGGGSNWSFDTTYGESVLTASSTIPVWFKDSIYASSTSFFTGLLTFENASGTQLTLTDLFLGGDQINEFAGTGLSVTGGTLNAEVESSDLHDAVTLSGTPDYITLSGQDIIRGTVDIGDDTNLSLTYPLTLTGDTGSLAFGTTTENEWSALNTFANATTTLLTAPNAWITKLRNLTSNGFVKTSGGDGTLSVDTSTYLTGNETITLSGDVSGSGATAITTTIETNSVALGTDTTGNYVRTVADAGNSTITVSGSGAEDADITLDAIDLNCTNCIGATEISDIYLLNNADDSTTRSLTATEFIANDGAATSTFAGGFTVQTNGLVVQDGSLNVGIGTTSPETKLDINGIISSGFTSGNGELRTYQNSNQDGIHVSLKTDTGTAKSGLYRSNVDKFFVYYNTGSGTTVLTSTNAAFPIAFGINDVEKARLDTTGNFGIGDTSPDSALDIVRTSSANDVLQLEDSSGVCEAQPTTTGLTWSCSSDISLKYGWGKSDNRLDWLRGIKLESYYVKKTGEYVPAGVIAQHIQEDYPELVEEDDNGLLTVSEPTSWDFVDAIQRLWDKITGNTERIEELEQQNAELIKRIEALENE